MNSSSMSYTILSMIIGIFVSVLLLSLLSSIIILPSIRVWATEGLFSQHVISSTYSFHNNVESFNDIKGVNNNTDSFNNNTGSFNNDKNLRDNIGSLNNNKGSFNFNSK
jgi:hypothetical protein